MSTFFRSRYSEEEVAMMRDRAATGRLDLSLAECFPADVKKGWLDTPGAGHSGSAERESLLHSVAYVSGLRGREDTLKLKGNFLSLAIVFK